MAAEEAGAVVAVWESEVADLGEEEGVAGEIMQMLHRLCSHACHIADLTVQSY